MKTIKDVNVLNKHIFLRTDCNVDIENGVISDPYRIEESYKTIDYLLKNGAKKITIGTHLGRPEGKINLKYSTKPIADFLAKKYPQEKVTLMENLRFDPREEENDKIFAGELAKKGDIFVNDAFGMLHRKAASTCAITSFLPAYAGFLIEKEVKELAKLEKPEKPFVVIIGGAKIETKLPLIEKFKNIADYILVGGLTANEAVSQKTKLPDNVILPVDAVSDKNNVARDIGPKTIGKFIAIIETAKTIFWNGNLGMTENEKFQNGSKEIAEAIAESNAEIKIIGGGDTVQFIHELNLEKKMTFISTGGGAALSFLAGENLPGLEALDAHHH